MKAVAGPLLVEVTGPECPVVQVGALASLVAELVSDESPHGFGIAEPTWLFPADRPRRRFGEGRVITHVLSRWPAGSAA